MGSIPVGDSFFYFVPHSCYSELIFHLSYPSLKFIFLYLIPLLAVFSTHVKLQQISSLFTLQLIVSILAQIFITKYNRSFCVGIIRPKLSYEVAMKRLKPILDRSINVSFLFPVSEAPHTGDC